MKTVYFKKSLTDTQLIKIDCKQWFPTKNGTDVILLDGTSKFYSSNDYYFWGCEDNDIKILLDINSKFYNVKA